MVEICGWLRRSGSGGIGADECSLVKPSFTKREGCSRTAQLGLSLCLLIRQIILRGTLVDFTEEGQEASRRLQQL